eukprot:scaffold27802_cov28-Tisochrysis_lutea.AAC.1
MPRQLSSAKGRRERAVRPAPRISHLERELERRISREKRECEEKRELSRQRSSCGRGIGRQSEVAHPQVAGRPQESG